MDASVQELLDLEWRLFDESSQAGQCLTKPEDRKMFTVARSSQLDAWSPKLRTSWRQDIISAQAEGRNLVDEKYICMLEHTDPEKYAALKNKLPAPSLEKLWLVDWICQAEAVWHEALVKKYPRLMRSSRTIYKAVDCQEDVSFEDILRGELMACSVDTLRLYASQVEQVQNSGGNLCELILKNTVQQLGAESLDRAEECENISGMHEAPMCGLRL